MVSVLSGMSLDYLCCDTAVAYYIRVYKNSFARIFLFLKVLRHRSNVHAPKVQIYMHFEFHERRLMPKVSSK